MARGKKNESVLTLEEKLAQALVPDWEQPYRIPENWCWTRLRFLVSHTSGNSKLIKGKLPAMHEDGLFPAFSASGQDVFYKEYEHEGNAVIVSAVGARCGKSFLAQGKWSAIANTHCVFPNEQAINQCYLFHLINDEEWWITSGSAQPFVSVKASFERPFALPPLAEQQRIVDRIEYLFSKLDEAKEKAQSVLDSFETRKASILHKAFTGELTAQWRAAHGVRKDEWLHPVLNDLAAKIFDGPFGSNLKSDDYVNLGIRVVRLENLKNLWFDDSKQSFVSEEKYETIKKHTVYPSDLIMSTFIAEETKVCQMPAYIAYAVNKADCIGIRLRDSVNTRYVLYYLSSKDVFYLLHKHIHGATRPRVNSKQIKAIPVPLANREEQTEIVRILDNLFVQEQQAKEAAEVVLEKIDLLKKSILARAFRGELGTNDPAEESAQELLKSIL